MKLRPMLLGVLVACSGQAMPEVATVRAVPDVTAVPMPEFQASSEIAADKLEAPWSLTATDGSGLVVTRVDARAVMQGPLAFTELHLYFENPEARIREGTFQITLPPGAAVSRFAMENDGQFMEAEVVEKQLARRAYEDFLHRKQDPALLEKGAGNQFSARVFPIAPRAQKHLVISFSQELPGERYTLPLRGLPMIKQVDVRLEITDAKGVRTPQVMSETNWTPSRDFVSAAPSAAEALISGTTVVAQLPALAPGQAIEDRPGALTLLVDTSASRALGYARYARNVRELVGALVRRYGDGLQIEVIAFDQDTQPMYAGRAADAGDAVVQKLLARGAAGASDLGQALASLASPRERVVVLTDGVFTAGKKDAALTAAVKQLGARKVGRVDVVLAGGIRDEALATSLVTAGLSRAGAVLDLDAGITDVAAGLGEKVLVDIPVAVAGATWVYPRVIKSARAGSRQIIYARLARPAPTLEVTLGGARRTVTVASGTPALVERAAATAAIAELEARLDSAPADQQAALRADIAKRSIAARVISSQTSLLVLESDADYARFGIDRRALADILVVGPQGLEQRHRSSTLVRVEAKPVPDTRAKKDAEKSAIAQEEAPLRDQGAPADVLAQDQDVSDGDRGGDSFAAKEDEADADDRSAPAAPPPRSPAPSAPSPAPSARGPGGPPSRPAPRPALAAPRGGDVESTTPPASRGAVAAEAPRRITRSEAMQRERRVPRNGTSSAIASDAAQDETGGAAWPPRNAPAPLQGTLANIDRAIKAGNVKSALTQARAWQAQEPGNVLALIGLGEALEATRDPAAAARIYGSIIDLFPGRADLRRFAGERLERIGATARPLAVDTYQRAVEERPDHMTGHRLLAYALLRTGRHAEAFAAILAGVDQRYPGGRFAGGERVLADDAGLIGAAYAAAMPGKRADITAALTQRGLALPTRASTRFIMYWETDANDVDFHIQDARGGHAFYSNKQLSSGGELYADITTGYGPECFAIEGTPKAGPYRLSIDYYSQGPMGYGMGLLQIVRHDGKGTLSFDDRPYVIMADHAYVDLGTFR